MFGNPRLVGFRRDGEPVTPTRVDERLAAIRDRHQPQPYLPPGAAGYCTECGHPDPCPTRALAEGTTPCSP